MKKILYIVCSLVILLSACSTDNVTKAQETFNEFGDQMDKDDTPITISLTGSDSDDPYLTIKTTHGSSAYSYEGTNGDGSYKVSVDDNGQITDVFLKDPQGNDITDEYYNNPDLIDTAIAQFYQEKYTNLSSYQMIEDKLDEIEKLDKDEQEKQLQEKDGYYIFDVDGIKISLKKDASEILIAETDEINVSIKID